MDPDPELVFFFKFGVRLDDISIFCKTILIMKYRERKVESDTEVVDLDPAILNDRVGSKGPHTMIKFFSKVGSVK